jgi:hypothetical protein
LSGTGQGFAIVGILQFWNFGIEVVRNNEHPNNEGGIYCQRRFVHSVITNINQRSPEECGPFQDSSSIHQLVIADLFLDFSAAISV